MSDIPLTIEEAAAALRAGRLTSVELTEAVLAKADRHDPWLGSFLARFPDEAGFADTRLTGNEHDRPRRRAGRAEGAVKQLQLGRPADEDFRSDVGGSGVGGSDVGGLYGRRRDQLRQHAFGRRGAPVERR